MPKKFFNPDVVMPSDVAATMPQREVSKPQLPPRPGKRVPEVGGVTLKAEGGCCPETNALLTQIRDLTVEVRELQRMTAKLVGRSIMLTANPPVTSMTPIVLGNRFNTKGYKLLYENTLKRMVRVEVFAVWGVPGAGLKIADGPRDADLIDIMTAAGTYGKAESKNFVVKAGGKLFAECWKAGTDDEAMYLAAMTNETIIRLRVFDPVELDTP